MKTRKMIKLINDERRNARNISVKGCDNYSTDYCYNGDFATCAVHSIDICAIKDLAACYNYATDVCTFEEDTVACTYGNEDYT